MNPADIATSAMASPAGEVSLWSMFLSAHIVVKIVMLGLLGASVWCWAIIINKAMLFSKVQKATDRFEQAFWSGNSLEELYATLSSRPTSGMASLFVAAMHEWKRSVQTAASSFMGLQTRIEKVLDVTIAREVEKLESHLLVLATVASAGPFVGLFGTVWGIMTSFRSIAASKNTSLAVVAPASPRRCWRPRSASSPPSRRSSRITSCRATSPRRKRGWRASPTNSRRFCHDKSISISLRIAPPNAGAELGAYSNGRVGYRDRAQRREAAARRAALRRHGRHQHDAVHRRDVGAADHIHGGGAAAGDRRLGRSAANQGRSAQYRAEADLDRHQRPGPALPDGRRDPEGRPHRQIAGRRQGRFRSAHLSARRQEHSLWPSG